MTSAYPDRCFGSGRFGPLPVRPCRGTCRVPRKHPARLRATYHRAHGIRYSRGCCSLGDDQLRGVTREHEGGGHTLAALKPGRGTRLGGCRLFIIMDNLSADKTPAIGSRARRENAGLCFTPASASRANPIGAQSGPLRAFAVGGPGHPDHPALARRLQDYLRWRSTRARNPKLPDRAGRRSWPAR